MNNYLSELTVIIVTYKTNFKILKNCLQSIDHNVKTIIVENSSIFKYRQEILNQFSNVEVICTNKNLGMGSGNNFGLSKVKTKYALILNPDIICDKNYFHNINTYLDGSVDFSIIGSQYYEKLSYKPAFFFNNKEFDYNMEEDANNLQKVDWVVGCSILVDLKKFDSKKIFDEKYFLFYEEKDLCLRLKKIGHQVYTSRKLKVDHLGAKGSLEDDLSIIKFIKIRNWHLMWSKFYYDKKNHNFLYALIKSIGPLIRSILKSIFYLVFFKKTEFVKYFFRSYGLISSIIGMSSWYRVD